VADVLRSARKAQPRWCWAQARWLGAHGSNAEEFIYRVQDGGDTPMDALLTRTSVAAESLGMADRIGLLAEGKEAEIVRWTAIRSTTSPWCGVMKHGWVYKEAPMARSAFHWSRRRRPPVFSLASSEVRHVLRL
jgi:imidazolonepropionase-like amidohydrolase